MLLEYSRRHLSSRPEVIPSASSKNQASASCSAQSLREARRRICRGTLLLDVLRDFIRCFIVYPTLFTKVFCIYMFSNRNLKDVAIITIKTSKLCRKSHISVTGRTAKWPRRCAFFSFLPTNLSTSPSNDVRKARSFALYRLLSGAVLRAIRRSCKGTQDHPQGLLRYQAWRQGSWTKCVWTISRPCVVDSDERHAVTMGLFGGVRIINVTRYLDSYKRCIRPSQRPSRTSVL